MSPEEFITAFYRWMGQPPAPITFEKKDYLSVEGSIDDPLFFIISGAVRAIYVSEDEEFTIRFGYQGSIIASLDSFLNNAPSKFYIQALRKTSTYAIPKDKYHEFTRSTPTLLALHAEFMESIVVSMLDREIDLLTSSPMERYQRLMARSPQVFQHIPLKYIAAYLRMTPETLSRMRNLDCNQDNSH